MITGQITPHFSWAEATGHSGFDTIPTSIHFAGVTLTGDTAKQNCIRHARNLEILRAGVNAMRSHHHLPATGINFLSWVRSPDHNHQVGGALLSRHQYWDATDLSIQEIERLCPWPHGHADFDALCNTVFSSGGFGTYPAGNRHVDSRGYRARWSSFTPGG